LVVLALVVAIVVGSVLAYQAIPGLRLGVNTHLVATVKELRRQSGWGGYAPVRPVRATASSQIASHGAPLLTDLINTDYWAADTSRDRQPLITISFAKPTDLDWMIVTSGAGPDFGRIARPKDVRLTYSDGTSEELSLRDDPRAAGYEVHGYSVTWVKMQILSVYPSTQDTWVAIAELEFWRLN
jgi:hypothetical protein